MAPWDPPPPPPEPSLYIEMPGSGPYKFGLLFNIVSQLVAVPLCILAFQFKKGPTIVQYLIGVLVAVLPLYVQPALAEYFVAQGWATELDVLAARFVGSSTYAFTAFRMFGAAAGYTPKGADADLATWIAYATAAVDPLFTKDGKPVRPAKGSIPSRLGVLSVRIIFLSIVSSLSHPAGGFPATKYFTAQSAGATTLVVAEVFDHVMIQLTLIYLFLSVLMDIGALLLIAQNYEVLSPFENPLFSTRSARDFWGKKWNIQVTTTLKRCVFLPLRKTLNMPAGVAATSTFLASGLFHEYQFLLSFPHYALGSISIFFGMHAAFAFLETLWEKALGKGWHALEPLPEFVKALIITTMFSPTIPYFTNIWIDAGMFDVMSAMSPQIKYA